MEKVKQWGIIAIVIVIIVALAASCGGSSSSSGRKWSDLSDTEKANAKWAYEAQQYINGR